MKIPILTILTLTIVLSSCIGLTKALHLDCYPNTNRPAQAITYQEMDEMIDAYDQGVKKELDKYMKKISRGKDAIFTNYNWYKLDVLKQYIAYTERIFKEKDIEVTRFRIYPTSYFKKTK